MNIADLDLPTKRLILHARLLVRFPSNKRLRGLREAVAEYDKAHESEYARNLIRALWGPGGLMREDEP